MENAPELEVALLFGNTPETECTKGVTTENACEKACCSSTTEKEPAECSTGCCESKKEPETEVLLRSLPVLPTASLEELNLQNNDYIGIKKETMDTEEKACKKGCCGEKKQATMTWTFTLDQRVRCKDEDDQKWFLGVVKNVEPLRILKDGCFHVTEWDQVEPVLFLEGQRVKCKDYADNKWSFGTVQNINPLEIQKDGCFYATEWDQVEYMELCAGENCEDCEQTLETYLTATASSIQQPCHRCFHPLALLQTIYECRDCHHILCSDCFDGITGILVKKKEPEQARTVLHCMGICCPAEVPLVEKILSPLDGVESVKVNVITRTVAVIHDANRVTPGLLCRMLNNASLNSKIQKSTASLDEVDHALMVGDIPGSKYPHWNVTVGFFFFILGLVSTGETKRCKEDVVLGTDCTLSWFKIFCILAILVTIFPILRRAYWSLKMGHLDTNCLMSIAVVGACIINDFVEASAVVILFSLAEWLETRASERAKHTLEAIINLRPDVATLAETGQVIPVEEVRVGTELLVRSGDKIPLDAVVVGGKSAVDESNLTGESKPVIKAESDNVSAGTVNVGNGYLTIRSTAESDDSAVAKLVRLVEEAQDQRSKTEELVETVAKYYTPIVVIAAVLVAIIPLLIQKDNADEFFRFSLVLLVIACPCALVISTPITYVVGLTEAARDGVLIKGGKYLEALGKINTVAFDKTGTLTQGKFDIDQFILLESMDEKTFFSILYTVENVSTHPMAVAICNYAKEQRSKLLGEVDDFKTIKGEGIFAKLGDDKIYVGNMRMLERLGVKDTVSANNLTMAQEWENVGGTVSWVVRNDIVLGCFSARDVLREEAREAIELLRLSQLKSVMLTGDNQGTAECIQREVELDSFHASLKPEDKVDMVKQLKAEPPLYNNNVGCFCFTNSENMVAMVGDGVNDAPALALADVGIAMGAMGTAVAMETADVSLMDTDLRKIHKTIILGRNCVNKIYQNIVFSIATKIIVLVIAIAGFSHLWFAIVTDIGSMLLVTANSMTLLSHRKQADECDRADLNAKGVEIAKLSLQDSNSEMELIILENGDTQI